MKQEKGYYRDKHDPDNKDVLRRSLILIVHSE